MIPAAFEYARPTTVDEALQAIAAGGDDVKILAGGQSLIPDMRLRLAAPERDVDLGRGAHLRGVRDARDPIVIAGLEGRRTVPAAEFFVDYLTTTVGEGELLVEVRVPKLAGEWGMRYEKFNRVAQAWSIVAVAAVVRRENGHIAEARIGLTNMGSTPLRASAVEAALAGAEATPEAIAEASRSAAEGTSPSSDLNAQADYREHLAQVLTRRAVTAAAGL